MLKRTMALGLALTLTLVAGTALAQPACYVGVYANADGTGGLFKPTELQPFEFYVVAFVEDLINAAAYEISMPDLFDPVGNPTGQMFLANAQYGPAGTGIEIAPSLPADANETVGLGECAIGLGGNAVVVAKYTAFVTRDFAGGSICVGPHGTEYQDPNKILLNNCIDVLMDCDLGPCLLLETPIATESESFGAVKALYGS